MTHQTAALRAAYRQARAHQASLFADGGMLTVYPSGRTERTFASAPYGEHALSAFASARRRLHFRDTLTADVKAARKRASAARKGWKTRRTYPTN